jgi:hypothetical protein
MPLYTFKDIETGEEWDELFSFSAKDEYLKENPNVQQVICAPAIISGITGVTHKNDSGFNDMLGRIAAANPHSPLAQVHGSKGVKESKTREAVNKAKNKLSL